MKNIKNSLLSLSVACATLLPHSAEANETSLLSANNFYLSAAATYSQVDHAENDSEGGGVELNFGYAINSSWNIEIGYLDALSEKPSEPDSSTLFQNGYDSKGFMLAILGKTVLGEGEFYYRAGIMRTEVDSSTFYQPTDDYNSNNCDASLSYTKVLVSEEGTEIFYKCRISEKKNAALFGLGYNYNFSNNWFLRTEIKRLFMRDGFYVDNFSLGLGYRF